jgi:glycerol-3-phosphate acyltransferase PlsY
MNQYVLLVIGMAVAYLWGAVPNGFLVARIKGVDIRTVGSGNIGATNVFRSIGRGWGLLTFLLDFLKGFFPAFVLPRLAGIFLTDGLSATALQGAGVAMGCLAIAGHNWSIFLGFRGGKGVATSAGVLTGIAPLAVLVGLVSWILLFLTTRYVSVASMGAAVLLGAGGWWLYGCRGRLLPVTLSVLAVLVIWRHRGNIQRLLAGKENRFEFGRKKDKAS